MSKEEKEAFDYLQFCYDVSVIDKESLPKIAIVLNLIEEQQKEIKQLKEDISNMYDEKVVRNLLEDECGLSQYEIDELLN